MPPLPTDSIHARACKLKCEKILTRPIRSPVQWNGKSEIPGIYWRLYVMEMSRLPTR